MAEEAVAPPLRQKAYLGFQLNAAKLHNAHVTWVYLGPKSPEEITKIVQDAKDLLRTVKEIELEFGDWGKLGKPAELEAGGGVEVRHCKLVNPATKALLEQFYTRYYWHGEGEAEERKLGPSYHLTVTKDVDRSSVEELKTVNVDRVFCKVKGREEDTEVVAFGTGMVFTIAGINLRPDSRCRMSAMECRSRLVADLKTRAGDFSGSEELTHRDAADRMKSTKQASLYGLAPTVNLDMAKVAAGKKEDLAILSKFIRLQSVVIVTIQDPPEDESEMEELLRRTQPPSE